MPMIPLQPDNGPLDAGPTAVPAAHGWLDGAWTTITGHTTAVSYAVAGILAVLLLISIRSRRKRTTADNAGSKQALTRADKAITRITGLIATAVLAQGMWVFFGDVLHLPEVLRVVLFAFVEFQIISAWRRALRTLHRHGHLGTAVRTIYVLAFGSALIASWHATSAQLGGFRWFVAFVAAYMIAEELAEELDIYLTANPDKRPTGRARGSKRINWALTPERILVWLRLAEPAERLVEEIERQRRIARFARTAHRLDTLKESKAAKWRIGLARRSLRRQAESANEHLNVATDTQAMTEIRSQLAFLYQVEDGTTRRAVSDLSPFRQAPRLAIAATPFESARASQEVRTEHVEVIAPSEANGSHRVSQAGHSAAVGTENGNANHSASPTEKPIAKADAKPAESVRKPSYPLADHPNDSVRKLARVYSRNPGKTNSELAKLARVSPGTANRYMAEVRAAAIDAENADADEERAQGALTLTPFALPREPVLIGTNGHSHATPEEN